MQSLQNYVEVGGTLYVVSTSKGKRKAGWKSSVAHTQNSGCENGGE